MMYCIIIPCFNHFSALPSLLTKLDAHDLPIVIIDDGSNESTKAALKSLKSQYESLSVVTHEHNQGKGGAVISGLYYAKKHGFSHAIQVDADGQHNLDDLSSLMELSKQYPTALVSGNPVYDDSIPKGRLYGRSITHFWVGVETLSLTKKDTMCGFRAYPVNACCQLFAKHQLGLRMDFDIEIMVRLCWQGVDVKFFDTKVIYPEDGVSHFQPFKDNVRISWLHTRLVCGMLIRLPKLLMQKAVWH